MKRLTFICGCALLLFMATQAVSVRSSATITINGADNFTTKQISMPNTLSSLVNSIADHIVLQYSDFKDTLSLTAPPAPLSGYLNAIGDRIVMQYADDEHKMAVEVVPSVLNGHLANIADRTVMQYADDSHALTLGYPKALLGDKTPPKPPVDPPEAQSSSGSITVSWTTDEFTTFVIQIGTSAGTYTVEVTGDQFKKEHQVTVTQLPVSDRYFYRIVSADLSGNEATSPEYSLETGPTQHLIYLPSVVR